MPSHQHFCTFSSLHHRLSVSCFVGCGALHLQVHVEEREHAVLLIVLAARLWLILALDGSWCLLEMGSIAVIVGTGIQLRFVPRPHTGIVLLEDAVNENCAA